MGKPKTLTIRKQAESQSVFDRCMSSSDINKENVLKLCLMRAKKKKKAERMERTNWQTVQKKVYNTKYRLIRQNIRYRRNSMFNHKYRNWDCGLLSVDYGSETTGYIWTINSGMNFFFWHNCKANTHIFLYVYFNFLPVLHIVNSPKITKTLMYSVLTKGIKKQNWMQG